MKIPVKDILVDHANNVSRDEFSPDSCQNLAAAIDQHGLIHPVLVRPIEHGHYKYQLVVGYRRMVACATVLGHEEIECYVRDVKEYDAKVLNIVENLERDNPEYWEECCMLNRTFDPDVSDLTIARRINKSRGWVRNRWQVWRLPDEVIAQVEAGLLSAVDVNMLLAKTPEEQMATAALIIRGKQEGQTSQELAERYSSRKAIRPKKQVQAMMTTLMEMDKMESMHVLRWALGEISETLLLELIE